MMRRLLAFLLFVLAFAGVAVAVAAQRTAPAPAPAPRAAQTATAVFAGGCFWCTESDFDHIPGVISTLSGYTGGHLANPSYEQVSAGGTGHFESVRVVYDPRRISYQNLVARYFRTVDPLNGGGQFCDHGDQYRTAIFVANPAERRIAEAAKAQVARRLGQPVATQILARGPFYPAEDYHQDYYRKNPVRYRFYRWNCGRDQRLAEVWGQRH